MDYEKNYKKNLKVLEHKSPRLFAKLQSLQENENFEVFSTKNGLDILDHSKKTLLYNGTPNDYIETKLSTYLKNTGYLPFTYHFGIGNGRYYKKLIEQKKDMVRVLILEPLLELVYIALHLNDFSAAIKTELITIVHTDDFVYSDAAALFAGRKGPVVFSKTYSFDIHLPYYEQKELNANNVFFDVLEYGIVFKEYSTVQNATLE